MTSYKFHSVTQCPTWCPPPDASATFSVIARVLFDTILRPQLLPSEPVIARFHHLLAGSDPAQIDALVADYLFRLATIASHPRLAIESDRYPGSGGVVCVHEAPTIAWACINTALEAAVHAGHAHVVSALLSVRHWQVCSTSAAKVVYEAVMQSRFNAQLVPALVADGTHITADMLRPVVKELVDSYDVLDHAQRLDVLMASPGFPAGLVWDVMMDAALKRVEGEGDVHVDAMLPILRAPSKVVVGAWQFTRAKNLVTRLNARVPPATEVPPRLLLGPKCPRLLVDLPVDIQLHVHDRLDLLSLRRLRLTCRALRVFPMNRFSVWQFACAIKDRWPSAQLCMLMEDAGRTGPAGLDCRALLMAVQRLDVDLALKYLYPMPEEQVLGYGIGTDGSEYMISWALLTLLHMLETAPLDQARSEPESSRIGLLLQAILEHPLLPSLSWVFTLSIYNSARRVLSSVSQSDSALLESRRQSHPPAARSRILLGLIRSGALSQSATSHFLLDQEQSIRSDPMPALSRIFLYLATLCRNPTTLSHILPYLTRPSAPPNLNSLFSHVPLTWALVTALATHHPTDPERFITHMLTQLDMHSHQGLAFHVSVRAIARGNHDAVDQLVVGIHDAQLLKSLLLPPFPHGTPPSMQMANAVVLTRWLHLTCAELAEMQAKREPLMVQAVRKGTARKKRVDYLELLQVEKWVKEYGEALEREGERGQARAGELDAAWEPVKAMMDEMTRASRRKSIGSKKEGRRGVNEGGCICQ